VRKNLDRVLLLFVLAPAVLAGCMDGHLPTAVLPALPDTPARLNVQAATSGSLVSWGSNGSLQRSNTPADTDFVAVAGGLNHSVALKSNGSLVSWGSDDDLQVTNTPAVTGFVAVAAGGSHSVALKSDGSLVSWGSDASLQVRNTPGFTGHLAVAAGGSHSVAVRSNGSLVSWGSDASLQVRNTPPGSDFVAVAAGGSHSVALKSNGSLVSWGSNASGQVTNTPAGTDFVAVAAGGSHSVALRSNGSLVSWGSNASLQVTNTPADNDFVAVAAGGSHSVALRADGRLRSWGSDGSAQVRSTPAGNDFIAVAAGGSHSVAIRGLIAAQVKLLIPAASPYDGNPRVATAITEPTGLDVAITYNGSSTPPADPGEYLVVGTVTSPGYAGSDIGMLTIQPLKQAISFTSTPPDPALIGDSYMVSATGGGSGNPVVFSSLTPDVCSVIGSTVSLSAAATCTIAADQAGNTFYAAAAQTTQAWDGATGYAQVTLQIPAASPYDGNPRVVTAVTDPTGLTVAITYNGSATPPTDPGDYLVVGTVTTPGYEGSDTGVLTIQQVAQVISFTSTPPDPALVGDSYEVSATGGASGNPVVFKSATPDVCSVTGSTVSLIVAKTCAVAADQAGTTIHAAAAQATQVFNVVKRSAQVALQIPAASPYDGNTRVATAVTDPDGLPVLITYNGSATHPSNAGTYTVVGTVNSESYTGSAEGTLTIQQAAQAITFTSTPPAPAVADGTYAVSATGGDSGNPVVFTSQTPSVCSVTGVTVRLVAAGICSLAANQAGNTNYQPARMQTQQFTVVVVAQVIDIQPNIISLSRTSTVTVYLYSQPDFDAAATAAATVRLRVVGGDPTGVPVMMRNGVYMRNVRDYNGDGLPDVMLSFSRVALQNAGLSVNNAQMVLEDNFGALKFQATDPAPPTIVN
jgi:hypothetical protein